MGRWMILALFCSLPLPGWAQEVSHLSAQGDGSYLLRIDGKTYIALSQEDAAQAVAALGETERLREQLAAVSKTLRDYQTLSGEYETLRERYAALSADYGTLSADSLQLSARYATAADDLITLNQGYGKLVGEYDGLVERYRRVALRTAPRQPLDIGVGAITSHHATSGVVMVGAGTRLFELGVRGWLFGGQESYGVMLGASF